MELRSEASVVPMILLRKFNFRYQFQYVLYFRTILSLRFSRQHLRVFYLRARTTVLEYPTEGSV